MPVIPLSDASRRPTRFPVVTASLIVINVVVFLAELAGGDPFVMRWSVVPADIVAGYHWINILTAMFLHGSWSHIRRAAPGAKAASAYLRKVLTIVSSSSSRRSWLSSQNIIPPRWCAFT